MSTAVEMSIDRHHIGEKHGHLFVLKRLLRRQADPQSGRTGTLVWS